MIALSYGITYIWGTVGIILITKYLPKWWGLDAKAAATEYEKEHGVASGDTQQLTGWTTAGLRAYRLENAEWFGKTVGQLLKAHPEYRVINVVRGNAALPISDDLMLKSADVIALGGRREAMTEKMGLIGPEVSDRKALDMPLDTADILVTNPDMLKLTHEELRALPDVNQIQLIKIERGGVTGPAGARHEIAADGSDLRRRSQECSEPGGCDVRRRRASQRCHRSADAFASA